MKGALRNEDGFALFAVLGAVAVITAVALSGFFLAEQAVSDSSHVQRENQAFQVAHSGLDRELATFSEAKFAGQPSYTGTGSTPDGQYDLTVGTTEVPFMYTIRSNGRSHGSSETVQETFFYLNLWDVNIGAGTNGEFPNPFGSGGSLNGNCFIWGPMYVMGDIDMNSAIELHNGPLFARDGFIHIWASAEIYSTTNNTYTMFATHGADVTHGGSAQVKVNTNCPQIDLPWVDTAYLEAAFERAKQQSSDNLMGAPDRVIANTEVSTVGDPASYQGTRAPGVSTNYYKVVGGATSSAIRAGTTHLTIGGTSFGRYPGNGYALNSAEHDDFAFDAANGILYVEGTVFIDGNLTLTSNVRKYVGNGTLVVNGNVAATTSGELRPLAGSDATNNLNASNCLGFASAGGVTVTGKFEGVVFCDKNFVLMGNWDEIRGTVHANGIDPRHPNQTIRTEPNTLSWLPESMPGGLTDPRGGDFQGPGIIARGTWTRQ